MTKKSNAICADCSLAKDLRISTVWCGHSGYTKLYPEVCAAKNTASPNDKPHEVNTAITIIEPIIYPDIPAPLSKDKAKNYISTISY